MTGYKLAIGLSSPCINITGPAGIKDTQERCLIIKVLKGKVRAFLLQVNIIPLPPLFIGMFVDHGHHSGRNPY